MDMAGGIFMLAGSLAGVRVCTDVLLISLIGTVYVSTRVCTNVFFGRVSDNIGRKHMMLLAILIQITALFLIPACTSINHLYLVFVLGGISTAMFWPVTEAWIGEDVDGTRLIRAMGTYGIFFTGGLAIGAFVTGILMDKSLPLLVGMAGALSVMSALLILPVPHVLPRHVRAQVIAVTQRSRKWKSGFVLIGWTANLGSWTAVGIIRFVFPKIASDWGYDPFTIGTLTGLFYATWTAAFAVMRSNRKWEYNMNPIIIGQVISIIALLGMTISSNAAVFSAGLMAVGVLVAITYYSSIYYCQDGYDDKGGKTGFHEMFIALGMLIGPTMGGCLGKYFGARGTFVFSMLTIAVVVLIEIGIARKHKFSPGPGTSG
jgi:MFS family permease